jgi:recombination protein RecA
LTRTRTKKTEEIADQIRQRKNVSKPENTRVEFISTGSTLLNLAASQKGRDGGWARGRIINPVGDGSSGKTLLALEACAQAHYYGKQIKSILFPKVEQVNLVYWNREKVMDFPLEKMYGQSLVSAIDWSDKCETCEQWGRDLFTRLKNHKKGEMLIGVLDSIDSLGSEAGQRRLEKSIKSDKSTDGTYGTERAKYFSAELFNNLCSKMERKDFTLFLISQVREKINAGMFEKKLYRTGGKALGFYTHQVPWLSTMGKTKIEHNNQSRITGITIKAFFERSKVAKPFREAKFNILFDYGLDDIGSMAEFLSTEKIQEGFRELFDKRVTREMLIDAADNDKTMYNRLIDITVQQWNEIEEATAITRNPRFKGE